MPYYRHYIETHYRNNGLESKRKQFYFSQSDADDFLKELKEAHRKDREKYPEHGSESYSPMFTHEITKEAFDEGNFYSMPIQQILYHNLISLLK